jgi:hypothetical protein
VIKIKTETLYVEGISESEVDDVDVFNMINAAKKLVNINIGSVMKIGSDIVIDEGVQKIMIPIAEIQASTAEGAQAILKDFQVEG